MECYNREKTNPPVRKKESNRLADLLTVFEHILFDGCNAIYACSLIWHLLDGISWWLQAIWRLYDTKSFATIMMTWRNLGIGSLWVFFCCVSIISSVYNHLIYPYSQKRKGHQDDCPGHHWRRWRQASTSPVMTGAVTLSTFTFLCSSELLHRQHLTVT